ncbi:hypothetical protein AB0J80_27695 [Actinoplanes sp. NPDC049548]|uniref:hypothetical protein n=1 Tax=Actinoplanes sp. NPDC049548 TaxID=3155152 RepID=UPI00343A5B60
MPTSPAVPLHWRADGVSLVLDCAAPLLPRVLHWGATGAWSPPGRVRLPGLDPDAVYQVRPLPPGEEPHGPTGHPLPWWSKDVQLSGQLLGVVGVQAPVLFPERLVLIRSPDGEHLMRPTVRRRR